MSNRERIQRAAEEARLAQAEKLAKKKARKVGKPPAKPRAPRMKLVWVVYNASGKPVKTYAYPDKAEAENEARRRSASTGQHHELRATRVPMD